MTPRPSVACRREFSSYAGGVRADSIGCSSVGEKRLWEKLSLGGEKTDAGRCTRSARETVLTQ